MKLKERQDRNNKQYDDISNANHKNENKIKKYLSNSINKVKSFFKKENLRHTFSKENFIRFLKFIISKLILLGIFIKNRVIRFLKFLAENWVHLIKAFFSGIVWGFGQLLNRQLFKAIFFGSFLALLIFIELGTGRYNEEISPLDKLPGNAEIFPDTLAQKFYEKYKFNVKSEISDPIEDFDNYYTSAKADGVFTNEELYLYIIEDLQKSGINEKTKIYNPTPLSDEFQRYMSDFYTRPGNEKYNAEDYTRFLIELHFMEQPEAKTEFVDKFSNFYHDKTGFFVKGIWSIITLGETRSYTFVAQTKYDILTPDSISILTNVPIQGHQSTYLLLRGIISTILLLYFFIIMVWSMRDAYKTSKIIKRERKVPSEIKYFKNVYENFFEYIVLFPAFFVISIISIMPIVFGFLIAFTNYDKNNLILVDWVGFDNFKNLVKFTSTDVPFGKVFPKVFAWTFVWAILSTATVFFGGFFQAIILNNQRVVFRKFWRGFLILPWAVPALISQMIFRLMFNEKGIVNEFLRNIGVYKKLFDWGMLGNNHTQINGFWNSLKYLGESDIKWFTNEVNSTFVRGILIIVNIWLGFPFFMALMTGVMTAIDKTLYEAAEIDGATSRKKFRFITFPLVLSSTAPLLLMTFSGNFNNFGVIYFITEGGYGAGDSTRAFAGQTDILISWMYRLTVTNRLYNMASVFSILIFLIIGTISAWNFTRMKAFKED